MITVKMVNVVMCLRLLNAIPSNNSSRMSMHLIRSPEFRAIYILRWFMICFSSWFRCAVLLYAILTALLIAARSSFFPGTLETSSALHNAVGCALYCSVTMGERRSMRCLAPFMRFTSKAIELSVFVVLVSSEEAVIWSEDSAVSSTRLRGLCLGVMVGRGVQRYGGCVCSAFSAWDTVESLLLRPLCPRFAWAVGEGGGGKFPGGGEWFGE